MPGVKRKITDSLPHNVAKSTKKQKGAPFQALSTEYVVDSSDDETAQISATAKSPSKRSLKGLFSSDTAKKSAPLESHPKSTKPQPNPTAKPKYRSPSNSPILSESRTPNKSDGEKSSNLERNSGSSRPVVPVRDPTSGGSKNTTDSEGTEESESESEGRDRKVERKPVQLDPSLKPPKPPPPYDPPPGFEAATIGSSTRIKDFFAKEKLHGKQIWHITAPRSVPIGSIEEIPIDKIASRSAILSYEGAHYGLLKATDKDPNTRIIMMPSIDDDGYMLADVNVTKTLHLQQIVKPPTFPGKAGGAVNGITKQSKSHVQVIRQQPKGLTMRYRPFGSTPSSEDSDTVPRFKMPLIISPAKTSKQPGPPDAGSKDSPPKDRNTHKKNPAARMEDHDAPIATESSSRKSKIKLVNDDQARTGPGVDQIPEETADEKARRRAEKKKRKQRKSSGTKDPWEAEEARKILSMSKQSRDKMMPANTGPNDKPLEEKELGSMKPKKRKRKSEATEEA